MELSEPQKYSVFYITFVPIATAAAQRGSGRSGPSYGLLDLEVVDRDDPGRNVGVLFIRKQGV
jgi:hypothetical protein